MNGKAAVVLLDPKSYDLLEYNSELVKTLTSISLANEQHEKGQSKPIRQVFKERKEDLKAKYPNVEF